jgi:DNA-binding response OmpR family regulator
MKLLLVEDEKYLARAITEVLKKNHYSVDQAHDGAYGLDCALTDIYDIIILDIMLPKMDGLTVLRKLRSEGISTPVILLTARGQVEDKIEGLDQGADDYLAKPFHTNELLARLRALTRRKDQFLPGGALSFEDIELLPHDLTLICSEQEVRLTLKETQLLELLINNRNIIISKSSIIEKVWGYDSEAEDNHVEVHISQLRKKLAQVDAKAQIVTVRGVGYKLAAPEKVPDKTPDKPLDKPPKTKNAG